MGLGPPRPEGRVELAHIELLVDLTLYSESVVFRASHEFTGKCYVEISRAGVDQLCVRFATQQATTDVSTIEREFANALLDHRVREELERTTESIRRLIVAQAFGEANFASGVHPGPAVDATPAN